MMALPGMPTIYVVTMYDVLSCVETVIHFFGSQSILAIPIIIFITRDFPRYLSGGS